MIAAARRAAVLPEKPDKTLVKPAPL